MNDKKITPQILKGFRDFLPEKAIIRQEMTNKIRTVFERFGFDPLETPALEYAETLLGKYGEDADKLLYIFEDRGKRKVGLRYDQTVPLARVIAQYQEIPKPFKRYQIQPVWRAENTQKGRYREFIQCDADIVGDNFSPTADAEILALFWSIYDTLGFKSIKINVNSRKLLKYTVEESFGKNNDSVIQNQLFLIITRILDKYYKIGEEGIKKEMVDKGFPKNNVDVLLEKIKYLRSISKSYKDIKEVDSDLFYSLQMAIENFKIPEQSIVIDPFMVRGLDYYTGLIFESNDANIKGSLGGGGRYDNLIGQFSGKDTTAIGFALGFDRMIEAGLEKKIFTLKNTNSQVLIATTDEDQAWPFALNLTTIIRKNKINTELYLNPREKLEKQLKYANKKNIPYVIIIGKKEADNNKVQLKDMKTRVQVELTIEEVIKKLC